MIGVRETDSEIKKRGCAVHRLLSKSSSLCVREGLPRLPPRLHKPPMLTASFRALSVTARKSARLSELKVLASCTFTLEKSFVGKNWVVLNGVLFSSLKGNVEFEKKELGFTKFKTRVMNKIGLGSFLYQWVLAKIH